MNRRTLIGSAMALAIPAIAGAHTPYGQWVTYRRKHLLIGCHRQDAETYTQAKVVVAEMDHSLPTASARIARAPSAGRLASLMGTDQLDLAILSVADAIGLSSGDGIFSPYGKIAIGVVAMLENDRCLIARSAFRDDHARLVAASVHETPIADHHAPPPTPLGWHAGAAQWRGGNERLGTIKH